MPIEDLRPPRRSRRLCALLTTTVALAAGALALPSPASAWDQHFCQWVQLGPGWQCYAGSRHTLQQVQAWSSGAQRVCAASFSSPWGVQNSDWRCDYGTTIKYLGGRVDGVGAIHNGDPYWMYTYGIQSF